MDRLLVVVVGFLLSLCGSLSAQIAGPTGVEGYFPPGPSLIPNAAAQAKIARVVREKYKAEFASRDPVVLGGLAHKLRESADGNADFGEKFVYLREARDVAIEAGDMPFLMDVIDDMAKTFGQNTTETKEIILGRAVGNARTPPGELGQSYLKVADAAILAGDLNLAHRAAWLAGRVATGNRDLLAAADEREQIVRDRTRLRLEATKAAHNLARNPDDPQLNQIVGASYCFEFNQWPAGLPYLAKCGTPSLKAIAVRDLAVPRDALMMAALADDWWDFSDAKSGLPAGCGHRRAAYWYDMALPGLSGERKAEVEKRIVAAKTETATPDCK